MKRLIIILLVLIPAIAFSQIRIPGQTPAKSFQTIGAPDTVYTDSPPVFQGMETVYLQNGDESTSVPFVTTSIPLAISDSSAIGGGTVSSSESTVTARGICWSTSVNPVVSGDHTSDGSGLGTFTSATPLDLLPRTLYYIRAYATSSSGTGYGDNYTVMTTPLLNGLVSYYKLDEVSGNVIDSKGTNTGTSSGALANQTGQIETAYSFDGSNDYINIPHSSSLNIIGNKISLSVWIYPIADQTGDRCIFGKVAHEGEHSSPYFTYLLTSSSTSNLARPRFLISMGSTLYVISNPDGIPNGQWSHVVGTYDGITMRLYINGVETVSEARTGNINESDAAIRIGSHAAAGEVWNGKLDEIGIWNKCLTATQVDSLYDLGASNISYPFYEQSPIALHPSNTHYFIYKNEPTVILTSGEHYGSVLNADFNYTTYLNTLQSAGLNGTRISVGSMVEYDGWFDISENTWAPATGKYLCPWARSTTTGYYGGGNKFDLTAWDETYFTRLKAFVDSCSQRDIIVEVMLFSAIYNDGLWDYSPMKSTNNINSIGNIARTNVLDLSNSGIVGIQNAMVAKIVTELNPYDNVIFEVCNEPYVVGGGSAAWEDSIISVIEMTELGLEKHHLISQNVSNFYDDITTPNPATDVFTFHYASQSNAYVDNLDLNKVIGNNETGYTAQLDSQYRREAYVCLLSGGAYFNNLDYSFTITDETGQSVPEGNPAGGGPTLRAQYTILKTWFDQFPFIYMSPHHAYIGGLASGVYGYCLANTNYYAIFIRGVDTEFTVTLPAGDYSYEWKNPKTGAVTSGTFTHVSGNKTMTAAAYTEDIALKILKVP